MTWTPPFVFDTALLRPFLPLLRKTISRPPTTSRNLGPTFARCSKASSLLIYNPYPGRKQLRMLQWVDVPDEAGYRSTGCPPPPPPNNNDCTARPGSRPSWSPVHLHLCGPQQAHLRQGEPPSHNLPALFSPLVVFPRVRLRRSRLATKRLTAAALCGHSTWPRPSCRLPMRAPQDASGMQATSCRRERQLGALPLASACPLRFEVPWKLLDMDAMSTVGSRLRIPYLNSHTNSLRPICLSLPP